MLLKSSIFHSCRAGSILQRPILTRSGAPARQSRVISAAAASPTLTLKSNTNSAPPVRYDAASSEGSCPGVFLSRRDCLDILNRITDSCEATSLGTAAVANDAKQDAIGEVSLMSQVLDALYDDAEEVFLSKRGYVIPRREAALVEATGGSPVYGEITGEGVTQFLRRVPFQSDDVLVDLGSGLGRLVLQVASSARLRRCVGIELSASRHEQACWAASQLAALDDADPRIDSGQAEDTSGVEGQTFLLRPRGGSRANPPQHLELAGSRRGGGDGGSGGVSAWDAEQEHRQDYQQQQQRPAAAVEEGEVGGGAEGGLVLSPVELRCEDLMEAELDDGTAFFLCSTAFSAAACRAVAERLARHPPFRLLVTSRALPFPSPLTLLGHFPCGFTWTAAGTAYVYVRSLREAPAGLLAAFLSAAPTATASASGSTMPCGWEAGSDNTMGVGGGGGGSRVVVGGVAWLPSTCTLTIVPGDLMV